MTPERARQLVCFAPRNARRTLGFDYERVIQLIDWQRVLIEARGNHLREHSDRPDDVCGLCIQTVLLKNDH